MNDINTDPPSKLLYYPYMRVPNNEWFTHVLLYWDKVATILPEDYRQTPQKLGPYTAELIAVGLVEPVSSNAVLAGRDFSYRFRSLLNAHSQSAPATDTIPLRFPVHAEKMGADVIGDLEQRGLARRTGHEMIDVDRETGLRFMAFLAAKVAEKQGLVPATDDEETHKILTGPAAGDGSEKAGFIRQMLLRAILPYPRGGVNPGRLADFKVKYSSELVRFRRRIEREVVKLSLIEDEEMRREMVGVTVGEMREQVEEIESILRENKFER